MSLNSLTAGDIAKRLEAPVVGDVNALVTSLNSLDDAGSGALAFCRETLAKRASALLEKTKASVILLDQRLNGKVTARQTLIFVKNPQQALLELISYFYPSQQRTPHISQKADIHPSAVLGTAVGIGPFCAVGARARIGDGTVLHPHVCIYDDVSIGKNCIIHAGAVLREGTRLGDECIIQPGAIIGADGFGYIPHAEKVLALVPQVGSVELGDQVDVGANSCVDRAALGTTTIGRGTKLDNLVQIGHNAKIGQYSLLCGQVGIGGSAQLGDGVTLGGNSGVADHIRVVGGVRVAAKAGVISDITEKGDYAGYPTLPATTWRRLVALMPRLPQLLAQRRSRSKSGDDE